MRSKAAFVMASLLTFLFVANCAHGQEKNAAQKDPTSQKLDEILSRLEKLEAWIAQLKTKNRDPWRVDARGLLIDRQGRPIGIWGIDSVIAKPEPVWIAE